MTSTTHATPEPHTARRGRRMFSAEHEAAMTPDERAASAFAMRAEGMTWTAIARALGYTARGGAHSAAMRYALKVSPATPEQRNAARPQALDQLGQLWQLVEPELGSADASARQAAIGRALKIIELYARWMDVAPSQTPPAQRLARYGLEVQP